MPHFRIRTFWTCVNVIMLLYTATYMPYKSAFIEDNSTGQFTLDWVVDGLFIMDMVRFILKNNSLIVFELFQCSNPE